MDVKLVWKGEGCILWVILIHNVVIFTSYYIQFAVCPRETVWFSQFVSMKLTTLTFALSFSIVFIHLLSPLIIFMGHPVMLILLLQKKLPFVVHIIGCMMSRIMLGPSHVIHVCQYTRVTVWPTARVTVWPMARVRVWW